MPLRQSPAADSVPPAEFMPNIKVPSSQVAVRTVEGASGSTVSLSCPDRTTTVPLSEVLSALRAVTNKVVDAAAEREHRAGREISCRAHCGACCRQLVPLSHTEAQQLPDLVAGLEPDHRERVVARFEAAIARLRETSMLSRLESHADSSREAFDALVAEYFDLQIACPFLEEESCSIHPVRPLICRQYLVTSDPAHCASASHERISRVRLAADVLMALMDVERNDSGARAWIPLILAPLARVAKSDTKKTVPDWMTLVFDRIDEVRRA
jgi:Fe-S-cluster containining protein